MKRFASAFADSAMLVAAPITMALAIAAAAIPANPANAQTVSEGNPAPATDPAFLEKLRTALQEYPELVVIASNEFQNRQREQQMAELTKRADTARVELSARDTIAIVLGNPKGKQTYIEFLDYRCGFCQRAHSEIDQLIAEDADNRVLVVMRPVLGPDSEVLARFALAAAQQSKFAEANDYLYENTVEADDAGLEIAAKAIGADWNQIRSAMSSPAISDLLAEHTRIGDELQVQGTPFFITPTKVHPGYVPLDQLKG